jgi:hypothetical protein
MPSLCFHSFFLLQTRYASQNISVTAILTAIGAESARARVRASAWASAAGARCERGCGWGELVRRPLRSFPCSTAGSTLVLLRRASPSPAWRARRRRHPAGPRAPSARRRRRQRGQAAEWVNGHAGPPQQLAGRSLLQPRHGQRTVSYR